MAEVAELGASEIAYDAVPYNVRNDIVGSQILAWRQISEPGCQLTGKQRVDIAREVRQAWICSLCAERKEALSPFSVQGEHDTATDLNPAWIEIIHRIATDPGRLSESWLKDELERGGLSDAAYIEMVDVISTVMVIDTFAEALGQPQFPLPEPIAGDPSGYQSKGAKMHDAWFAYVEPGDETLEDGEIYPAPPSGVIKALSIVPDAKRNYWSLIDAHYLDHRHVFEVDFGGRAITRPQIEVVAGRVAAVHQCVY